MKLLSPAHTAVLLPPPHTMCLGLDITKQILLSHPESYLKSQLFVSLYPSVTHTDMAHLFWLYQVSCAAWWAQISPSTILSKMQPTPGHFGEQPAPTAAVAHTQGGGQILPDPRIFRALCPSASGLQRPKAKGGAGNARPGPHWQGRAWGRTARPNSSKKWQIHPDVSLGNPGYLGWYLGNQTRHKSTHSTAQAWYWSQDSDWCAWTGTYVHKHLLRVPLDHSNT